MIKGTLSDTDLRALPVAEHAYGKRWQGIRHADFAHMLRLCLRECDYEASSPKFETYRDGEDLAASWEVGTSVYLDTIPSIGLLTSNARRFSPRLYVGAVMSVPRQIHVKDCAIVTAEIPLGVKLIKASPLKPAVLQGLAACAPALAALGGQIKALVAYRVGTGFASRMLWQAARGRLLAWSRLAVVDAHFVQLKPENQTAWELYKATSRAIRKYNHPFHQMRQLLAFYQLLDSNINK